jgi:phage tail-like protein
MSIPGDLLRFPSIIGMGMNAPRPKNMFQVIIGTDPLGSFLQATGMGYKVPSFDIHEGGRNHSMHIRPFDKPGEHSPVTLKWGSVKRDKMESWIMSVAPGHMFRRNVFLVQMDRIGIPFRVTTLFGAWPKEWEAPEADSTSNELATEKLTLAYEGIVTVAI